MSVCILHDQQHDNAALYCSTSDFAFGPVFSANGEHGADERAEAFLRWISANPRPNVNSNLLGRFDVRHLNDTEMQTAYSDWLAQEQEQYAREELERQVDGAEYALEDR